MHPLIDLPLRALAALVGGYVLANLAAVALGAALPLARVDSALLSIQISFLFYAVTIIWVFAVQSVWLAIGGLVGVALCCAPVVWLLADGVAG